MWGTFWVWDARLTSMLLLFFLYAMYIIIARSFTNRYHGAYITSILCIIGFINLPIIKYSVNWWSTLHQASSINSFQTEIHISMLVPILMLFFALIVYFLILTSFYIYRDLIAYKAINYYLNKQ
jgi:heme exporter protein C